MRQALRGGLAALGERLASMASHSAEAMGQATRAVLTGQLSWAEQVISADAELDAARTACEQHAQRLLALQSPVAGDLRTTLAGLYCAVKLERMGDLAAHLAGLVRYSHPEPVVPPEAAETVQILGSHTVAMAGRLPALASEAADGTLASMQATDHAVDRLCTRLMTRVRSGTWPHGVPAAVNLVLLVRFYERFADQAVSVARRLEFATTGTLPQ